MKINLKGQYGETTHVWLNGVELHPERSQSVINHSPDGFGWGYGGSGPSQLALAILLEALPEEDAKVTYQRFKWDVISELPKDDFDVEIDLNLYES